MEFTFTDGGDEGTNGDMTPFLMFDPIASFTEGGDEGTNGDMTPF